MILGVGLVSGSQLQVIRDYGFVPYTLFHINTYHNYGFNENCSDLRHGRKSFGKETDGRYAKTSTTSTGFGCVRA